MKIVLAYSGGLDTSVILKWLVETYQAEARRAFSDPDKPQGSFQ
jgi:argininosuccinate synthase